MLFGILGMAGGFAIGYFDRTVGICIMAFAWMVGAGGWIMHRRTASKKAKNAEQP
jgi:hypothetical protein